MTGQNNIEALSRAFSDTLCPPNVISVFRYSGMRLEVNCLVEHVDVFKKNRWLMCRALAPGITIDVNHR